MGTFKIVASADLGGLGPKEGRPVFYTWHWYYYLPRALIWLFFALFLLLLKANRTRRAWLIVLPPVAAYLAVTAAKLVSGSFPRGTIYYVFQDLVSTSRLTAIGLTAVWLLSHKLSRRNRLVVVLQVAVIMTAIFFLDEFLQRGLALFTSRYYWYDVIFSALTMLVLLLGLTISFLISARRFTIRSFMMRLPLWLILVGVAVMFAYTGGWWLFSEMMHDYPGNVWLEVLLIGISMGVLSYLVVLPFMILSFLSKFYRDRLYAVLRLKGMTGVGEQGRNQGVSSVSD